MENKETLQLRMAEEPRRKLREAGLSEPEIKVVELLRHVTFGHLRVKITRGVVEGRIEYKQTY